MLVHLLSVHYQTSVLHLVLVLTFLSMRSLASASQLLHLTLFVITNSIKIHMGSLGFMLIIKSNYVHA